MNTLKYVFLVFVVLIVGSMLLDKFRGLKLWETLVELVRFIGKVLYLVLAVLNLLTSLLFGWNWLTPSLNKLPPNAKGRFMVKKEWDKLLGWTFGLIVNGNVAFRLGEKSFSSAIVIGPAGSMKTVVVFIPNVLELDGDSSAVVVDPKGEVNKLCSPVLIERGFEVMSIGENVDQSWRINVLRYYSSRDELRELVDLLFKVSDVKASGDNTFWVESAKTIILVVLMYLKTRPNDKEVTLANASLIVNLLLGKPTLRQMITTSLIDPIENSIAIGAFEHDDKVLASIISQAKQVLSRWGSDETYLQLCSSDNCDLANIRSGEKPVVLFLNFRNLEHYRPLASLILSVVMKQSLRYMPDEAPGIWRPLYLMVDEYHQTRLDLPRFITIARGYEICTIIVVQSLSILEELHSAAQAKTIWENMYSKIVMPGVSDLTAKRLSDGMDMTQVEYHEEPWWNLKRKKQKVIRKLMTPSEIRMLKDQILYLGSDQHPLLMDRLPWFKNPLYAGLDDLQFPRLQPPKPPESNFLIDVDSELRMYQKSQPPKEGSFGQYEHPNETLNGDDLIIDIEDLL